MSETSDGDRVKLQYGDIIQIDAPNDETIDQKQYIIEYIDSEVIHLIGEENEFDITILENGTLDISSITSIQIINRSETPSYARQNLLVPKTWVDIHFQGLSSQHITGQISNLEEDMIEISTKSGDTIYIDFEYKGIPKDLGIQNIYIIDTPQSDSKDQETSVLDTGIPDTEENNTNEQNNKIVFGEELVEVEQVVEVDLSEKRYDITKQSNDMMDDMLSTIPNSERSKRKIDYIHTTIQRFNELRNENSTFDQEMNAISKKESRAVLKPLSKSLQRLSDKHYWIIPVTKDQKKLYDLEIIDDDNENYLNLNKTLDEEIQKINDYTENTHNNKDESKYVILNQSVNGFSTPYLNPDSRNGYTQPVNTQITAVLGDDNLEGPVAKYVKIRGKENELSALESKKFLLQQYITGQNILDEDNDYKRSKKLTSNDNITIASYLMLPHTTLSFSRINLPTTNIMTRSNLNNNFLSYSKFLTETSIVEDVVVNNEPIEHKRETYLKNIQHYTPDTQIESKEQYERFINLIIPSTKETFELMENKTNDIVSVYELIQFLEPFMIYHEDIGAEVYKKMIGSINENIRDYKKKSIENLGKLSALRDVQSVQSDSIIKNLLRNEQSNEQNLDLYNEVIQTYGLDDYQTDGEKYTLMYSIDGARLFNTAVTMTTTELLLTDKRSNLEEIDTFLESRTTKSISGDDDCNKRVLSKKYMSLEELTEDNGKKIFFDKRYDNTFYDLVDEYKDQLNQIDNEEEKVKFLANQLQETNGLNDVNSIREAEAMLYKKRPVIDGDYAVLDGATNSGYYKRVSNNWQIDETMNEDIITDETKLFCNFKQDCVAVSDSCVDIKNGESTLNDNLKETVNDFDAKLRNNLIMNREMLKKYYQEDKERVILLKLLETKRNVGGVCVSDISDIEINDVIHSPYERLRDAILAEQDIVTRYGNIKKFVTLLTRRPNEGEDPWWLVCQKTDTKLLPIFIYEMSIAFENGNYLSEVKKICDKQGVIGDDESLFVDKYSGYTIAPLAFVEQDEFTDDGFKIVTSEVIYDETDITTGGNKQSGPEQNDTHNDTIKVVIQAMSNFTNINLDAHKEFITHNVSKSLKNSKILLTEKKYKEFHREKNKKSKILPYSVVVKKTIVITTICYILICVQSNIPNVTTQKDYLGCKANFSGYPMEDDDTNNKGIEYLACIVKKLSKNTIEPWQSLSGSKIDDLQAEMKMKIRILIKNTEVKQLISRKKKYLSNPNTKIIENQNREYNSLNQLLPIDTISLSKVDNSVVETFSNEKEAILKEQIKNSSKQQYEALNIAKGKVILISVKIQRLIQKIIKTENANILSNSSNIPFLENACCQEGTIDAFRYFSEKKSEIKKYDKDVLNITRNIVKMMHNKSRAQILFVPNDTKPKHDNISNDGTFTQDTIYRAFVHFCNREENTTSICGQVQPNNANSTAEQIEALKNNGLNYNTNNLLELMDIVNRNNIIDTGDNTKEGVEETKENVYFDDIDDSIISSVKQEVSSFMKDNTNASDNKVFLKSLETITTFVDKETTIDTILNLNNIIRALCCVFPNIIQNDVNHDNINIPAHWELSDSHNKNIQGFVKAHYMKLQGLNRKKDIKGVVANAMNDLKQINDMANSVESYVLQHGELPMMIYQYMFFKSLKAYIISNNDNDNQETVASVIKTFCEILSKERNKVLYTYDELTVRINRAKEKEKNELVEKLTNLSDDAREIENLHKESKLEKWGVGLRNDFGNYTKEGYDQKIEGFSDPDADASTDVYTDADYQDMEGDQPNDGNSDYD